MRLRGLAAMSAIALVAAGFVVACGAFGSDPGTAPPGSDDGATAASDVSIPEGSVPDGAAVADVEVTDGGCEILLRETFDSPTLMGFSDTVGNTGSLSVETSEWTSSPSSLYAEGTTMKGVPLRATKERDVPLDGGLAAGSLELDFDVYLEQSGSTYYAELGCTLELRDDAIARTRLVFARTTGGALVLSAPRLDGGTSPVLLGSFATLGWHHVHGHVASIDPTTVGVEYAVAPDSIPAQSAGVSSPTSAAVNRVRLVCGIDYATSTLDASTPVSVFVDNLALQQCRPAK